jgi:hypothetical protein
MWYYCIERAAGTIDNSLAVQGAETAAETRSERMTSGQPSAAEIRSSEIHLHRGQAD